MSEVNKAKSIGSGLACKSSLNLLVKKALLEAGVALNSTCIEETKAIFKTVEKEILQDKSPNVAAFSKGFIRTNNTFNPSSSATLKRCPEETFGTTDGKKARASLPIVSPSNY